ncbi:MAG: hypothetical protein ACJAYE_000850 [Candidatus Azotimanducaceae bacterium]|jgi:hypothetical protein
MMRMFGFGLIALLTFCSFIVVFAPASLIWRVAEKEVIDNVPDLHVLRVSGTVWSGAAELVYRQFPTSLLNWTIAPLPLLGAQIETQLVLSGEGHELNGDGLIKQQFGDVKSLTGFIDASYINRVSEPQGLTFSGTIDIQSLSFQSDLLWIQEARGRIYWPGGKIVSRTLQAGTRVFDLPALTGDISMQGDSLYLNLHHNNETIIDILVKPDGWISVAVKARLFDLANLPWPAGSSPSDTVLEFEEKLLRSNR